MSSSSNDSQSPPPPPPSKPDGTPPKVRGLFGKQSLPPPPAGRGPVPFSQATAAHVLPTPPVLGAPDLPATVTTLDDPLADFFADAGKPQSFDAHETPLSVHDEPTRSVPREELMLMPSVPSVPPENAQVAKLGLAKTMMAGPAHEVLAQEVMANEPHRDPRAEPNTNARESQSVRRDLVGVVFDPDQSVARHLGESSIDGDVGSNAPSDALRDLPLPQVPSLPAPMSPIDELPVRSMRSAMIVISLVLVSGGAATLVSLGVIGGSPAKLREKVATTAPTPAVIPPTTPALVVEPLPKAEPTPETTPEPVEPASAVIAPTPSGDPIADGEERLRAGNPDGALIQYQTALTADPRDHHAMEGLARVHLARNQAAEALVFADQIVKRRPKRAAYRILQGQARSALGDRAGARAAFQEALELEPDNRDAQRLLGQ